MRRIQLALTVSNVDAATDFYRTLFGTEPAKERPGYANFAIDEPPLKLVLIEGEAGGTLNHLGVEVSDPAVIESESDRLAAAGLLTRDEADVECCYARQDKVWVTDPDGAGWEIYTVTGDSDRMEPSAACCA